MSEFKPHVILIFWEVIGFFAEYQAKSERDDNQHVCDELLDAYDPVEARSNWVLKHIVHGWDTDQNNDLAEERPCQTAGEEVLGVHQAVEPELLLRDHL